MMQCGTREIGVNSGVGVAIPDLGMGVEVEVGGRGVCKKHYIL